MHKEEIGSFELKSALFKLKGSTPPIIAPDIANFLQEDSLVKINILVPCNTLVLQSHPPQTCVLVRYPMCVITLCMVLCSLIVILYSVTLRFECSII